LEPEMEATVVSNHASGSVRRRIMEMGILPGVRLEMVRRAPLGDPLEVVVKGYHLSLRMSEARCIEVEVLE